MLVDNDSTPQACVAQRVSRGREVYSTGQQSVPVGKCEGPALGISSAVFRWTNLATSSAVVAICK